MPRRLPRTILVLLLLPSVAVRAAPPQDLGDAAESLATGRYRDCLGLAQEKVAENPRSESWHDLLIRAHLALGEYDAAMAAVEVAREQFSRSIAIRLLAHEVYLRNGDEYRARSMLGEIDRLYDVADWRYDDAENLVVVGRARALLGRDAKEVMDDYFTPAKTASPELALPRIAIAELALGKHDYRLAADELQAAAQLEPEDAHIQYLLARAFETSDQERSATALKRTIELNPSHVEALLLSADQLVAGELYDGAASVLDRVLEIEPGRWEALAYRAVLAHLSAETERETANREAALARWDSNPGVDHLIGRELSEKYRFAEGAEYQRRALELDDEYLPARFQLAQDLLRLGQEKEGWELAEDVLDEDGYNVVAYNLMVLHDELLEYRTLSREGLVLRMEAREAEVYGDAALDLLERARDELSERYRIQLERPVIVELFREQKDFAIRTFGLPGGAGFLGVCFGDVVTMTSPASQGDSPSNWQAVLWHEFCHVITLNKTRNRMPRWLSEGISVHEERREDPSWGQVMTPAYRERILAGRAAPVSQLSSSFLRPEDGIALQFAYYESSMVVEYLLETYGETALLAVLDDLAQGVNINESLGRRAAPIDELDAAFDVYLRAAADSMAPGATWEPVDAARERGLEALVDFARDHPDNLPGLALAATGLIDDGRVDEAVPLLEHSLELCPTLLGESNPYALLAVAYRNSGDEERERELLSRWVEVDADALGARQRLMTLCESRSDWDGVLAHARGALAIQPMNPFAHRQHVVAARELGRPADVLRSGHALLAMDPVDPARVHYWVAQASFDLGDAEESRRQVLRSLEEAPRFREAHALLLDVTRELAEEDGEGR